MLDSSCAHTHGAFTFFHILFLSNEYFNILLLIYQISPQVDEYGVSVRLTRVSMMLTPFEYAGIYVNKLHM